MPTVVPAASGTPRRSGSSSICWSWDGSRRSERPEGVTRMATELSSSWSRPGREQVQGPTPGGLLEERDRLWWQDRQGELLDRARAEPRQPDVRAGDRPARRADAAGAAVDTRARGVLAPRTSNPHGCP